MRYYITPERWKQVPDDYKTNGPEGSRSCFICFLTQAYTGPGTTLCFEGKHFTIGYHKTYTETQRANGGHAVRCLSSQPARDLYDSGAVEVWEYLSPEPARLDHLILYAYQYGEEYGEDLTETELEDTLAKLAQHAHEAHEEAIT